MLSSIDKLRWMVRPPGRGILTLSTGGGYAARLLKTLYGTEDPAAINARWEDEISRIRRAEVILLGIPSDTGASIVRGANLGPLGIRESFLKHYGAYPKNLLDIGDVAVVPQLLHDSMLNKEQVASVAKELYPGCSELLPVSPLSIAEAVIGIVLELNPKARVVCLGGDHSVTWPAVSAQKKKWGADLGILHFDAHTDLLATRFGVKYTYTTWAYHALQGLAPQALVQVGIRTTGKPKEYWEQELKVVQVWAQEVAGHEAEVIQNIIGHFETLGLKKIYISNDIDGTDIQFAAATGTPEKNGLRPEFVSELMETVCRKFEVVGADLVEVAPPLATAQDFSQDPTGKTAADYLKVMVQR